LSIKSLRFGDFSYRSEDSLLGEVKRIPIKRRNRIFTAYRESGFSASGF